MNRRLTRLRSGKNLIRLDPNPKEKEKAKISYVSIMKALIKNLMVISIGRNDLINHVIVRFVLDLIKVIQLLLIKFPSSSNLSKKSIKILQ